MSFPLKFYRVPPKRDLAFSAAEHHGYPALSYDCTVAVRLQRTFLLSVELGSFCTVVDQQHPVMNDCETAVLNENCLL